MAATTAVIPSEHEALATEAPYAPVTCERRVRADLERTLPKPPAIGVIISVFFSSTVPSSTRMAMGLSTLGRLTLGWFPSPFFPIYIDNIHKDKHRSDTGTYDTEGRYIPAHLENMFSKYGRTVPDKITLGELWDMTEGNRHAFDLFGWVVSKLEWGVLYILARDEDGMLSKEALRRCFDGSLFDYCAKMQMGAEGKMG
ncbi:hypothetical protein NL676_021353 [Syzygium grande]|nr:hypothetical protein NL676_021353 [Syzygium grande]